MQQKPLRERERDRSAERETGGETDRRQTGCCRQTGTSINRQNKVVRLRKDVDRRWLRQRDRWEGYQGDRWGTVRQIK